ncbi:MAG: hypothetical protein V4858_30400, partial [Pseudomonadota bacterium]
TSEGGFAAHVGGPVIFTLTVTEKMHLFRTQPLIAKLARGQVSNAEKAYYLLASFLMFTVAYYTGLVSSNATWTLPSTLEGIAIGVITVIGVVKSFDASGGEESSDFVAQFTCLYVPITITTMLVVWSVFWGVLFGFRESLIAMSESHMQFAINLSRLHADMFNFVTFVAVVAVQGITFYRMTRCLNEVRELRNDS